MNTKKLARITDFSIGKGGYDDAMFGIRILFSTESTSVGDFEGTWSDERPTAAKWTEQDRLLFFGRVMLDISKWMKQAKVNRIEDMIGVPVEITFNGNQLQSWRILTEVL